MSGCRLCKGKTKQFLDLGKTPLPEEFRTKSSLHRPVRRYSLNIVYCTVCNHVQLGAIVPEDEIYKKNYFYDYSVTQTGLTHWKELAREIESLFVTKEALVVDVGSNTGVLLEQLQKKARILGVDPSPRTVSIAKKRGIPTIQDYFSLKTAQQIVKQYGQATVITCTNTFDHVENLLNFMQGITVLLKPEGVFIIEVPYFITFLKTLNHVVYHQQIDYITLVPLQIFLSHYDLEIVDATIIPIHGGSIRIVVRKRGMFTQTKELKRLILREKKIMKHWQEALLGFSKKIIQQRDQLKSFVGKQKKQNKNIAAVGASAKGITLLNYCGFDNNTIDFIAEKSMLKINRFTPSGIPIVSDNELLFRKPDYVLLLAWNFKEEIMKNLSKYKGIYIKPIPTIIGFKKWRRVSL